MRRVTRDARSKIVRGLQVAIVALVAVIPLAGGPHVAAQDAGRVQLGVKPIGVDGSYFELTMAPGETRQLTVELGNYGTRDALAMTYRADVYSLVNGGMGVRLAGEPASGATTWVGYRAESVPLSAGQGTLRSFPVSVPQDAGPGEYITSIVVEDATPAAEAADGGVAATRVNRQAIAIAIAVPGPVAPALALGAIAHRVSGGRSVITVEVENTGNVRLQPAGELVLTTPSGGQPRRFPVAMDSVYAGTRTVAEIAFSTVLEPGDYLAGFAMADSSRSVTARTDQMTLEVPPSTLAVSAPATSELAPAAASHQLTLPILSLAAGIAVVSLASLVMTRRRLPRSVRRMAPARTTPVSAPAVTVARPVTIRQLDIPQRRPSPEPDQSPASSPRFKQIAAAGARSRLTTPATSHPSKGT